MLPKKEVLDLLNELLAVFQIQFLRSQKMKKAILLVFFSILFIGSALGSEKEKPSFESYIYSGFKSIESFSSLRVYFNGTAKDIGLNKDELTNFLKLRFKNSFAGTAYQQTDFKKIMNESDAQKSKRGVIEIKIWTVGNDYPIAFHIEISSGNYSNFEQYKTAFLGYSSKEKIFESVKKSITELVDDLAVSYFKARGEL